MKNIGPSNTAHQKALKLQRKIFQSLQSEVDVLLGKMPDSILKYEREYLEDFKNTPRISQVDKYQLINSIRKADITLIADYHTFDQAQRTALRIIRETVVPQEKHSARIKTEWFVGLELIPSQFQDSLDQFQNGKLSVEEFHRIISYQEEWGFPWGNYAPIFDWAKENKIRLIALNRPKLLYTSDQQDLEARDQWAAGIIGDVFQASYAKKLKPKMIILYGELHISKRHIPLQIETITQPFLKKRLRWVSIHQNVNKLYWKLCREHPIAGSSIFKLKNNTFCVFSSTPWAKLQSLITWAEGTPRSNHTLQDSLPIQSNLFAEFDDRENEIDYLSLVQTYGNTIAEFLGIQPPTFEELNIYSLNHTDFIHLLNRDKLFNSLELKLIRFHISHNHRIYIPRISAAYLGSPSPNAAAELAAIHLMKILNRCQKFFDPKWEDFFRLILESSFGFLGSLILNPHRKCDLIHDHITRIENLKEGQNESFPQEKAARELVIDFLKPKAPESQLKEQISDKKAVISTVIGAKYLGKIFGKKLHQALLNGQLSLEQAKELFLEPHAQSDLTYEEKITQIRKISSLANLSTTKADLL